MADPLNHLFYGDNLPVLRKRIPDESVDLIYLDPPFNSKRSYNVLFRSGGGVEATAQIRAFDDTWHWSQQAEAQFEELVGGGAPPKVADAIAAMRTLLNTNDVLAYLVMMTARLVELHRVLKPTGSLYLHCDPTASHYLKVVLDAVFGPRRFLNEIAWCYRSGGASQRRFARKHDILLFYSKTPAYTFNPQHTPYVMGGILQDEKGPYQIQHGKRVDFNPEGALMPDWWEIGVVSSVSKERLGYPTQKPLALLERIIQGSSNEGDIVLDPFCGCGTAVDAAQKLRRRWIGIDITYLAIDLIRKRLRNTYGDGIEATYQVHGIPADLDGAKALFEENPFDFERWAVSLLDAQPNEKQRGDKGIDGRVRFYADKDRIGQALVSVKGGQTVNPGMVRDLRGAVERERAELGVLVVLTEPTRGMRSEADNSGSYVAPLTGQTYPRLQVVTVADLMAGKRPKMPAAILPYLKAQPHGAAQLTLDP